MHQYGDLVRTAPLDITDPAAADAAVQLAIDDFRAQIEANLFGVVNVT